MCGPPPNVIIQLFVEAIGNPVVVGKRSQCDHCLKLLPKVILGDLNPLACHWAYEFRSTMTSKTEQIC